MASPDDLYWAPSPNRFRQAVQPVLNIPSRAEEERRRAIEMLGVPERSVTRETRYSGFLDPLYEGLETAGLNVAGGARWLVSPLTGAIKSLWDEPVSAQIQLGTDVDKETADYIASMSSLALPGVGFGGSLLSGAVKAGQVMGKSVRANKYNDIRIDEWKGLDAVQKDGTPMVWGYQNLPDGRYAVRLNLQAQNQVGAGTKTQAIHTVNPSPRGGNAIGDQVGHSMAVPLVNVETYVHHPSRVKIAGVPGIVPPQQKVKAAAIIGDATQMSVAQITKAKNTADVVGRMNPKGQGVGRGETFGVDANPLFIDEATGLPIKSADMAIVEGNRVYFKGNVQYFSPDEVSELFPRYTVPQDAPLFLPYQSELFDLRHSFRNYPQFAIPRDVLRNPAKIKEAEEKWAVVSHPDNLNRMRHYFDVGAKKGGLSWYNTEPIRLRFLEEFGPEMGNNLFAKFMGLVAATSPQTQVSRNIVLGMEIYGRMMRATTSGQSVSFAGIPSLIRGAHTPAARDVIAATDMSPGMGLVSATDEFGRPKVLSFGENLQGNLYPVASDVHNLRVITNFEGPPTPFNARTYGYAERPQQELAESLSVPPAQLQSSMWVGAAEKTGVVDERPFIQLMEENIKRNAELSGMTPEKWFRKWLRGDIPVVYSMGPFAMSGGSFVIANQLFEKEDTL